MILENGNLFLAVLTLVTYLLLSIFVVYKVDDILGDTLITTIVLMALVTITVGSYFIYQFFLGIIVMIVVCLGGVYIMRAIRDEIRFRKTLKEFKK